MKKSSLSADVPEFLPVHNKFDELGEKYDIGPIMHSPIAQYQDFNQLYFGNMMGYQYGTRDIQSTWTTPVADPVSPIFSYASNGMIQAVYGGQPASVPVREWDSGSDTARTVYKEAVVSNHGPGDERKSANNNSAPVDGKDSSDVRLDTKPKYKVVILREASCQTNFPGSIENLTLAEYSLESRGTAALADTNASSVETVNMSSQMTVDSSDSGYSSPKRLKNVKSIGMTAFMEPSSVRVPNSHMPILQMPYMSWNPGLARSAVMVHPPLGLMPSHHLMFTSPQTGMHIPVFHPGQMIHYAPPASSYQNSVEPSLLSEELKFPSSQPGSRDQIVPEPLSDPFINSSGLGLSKSARRRRNRQIRKKYPDEVDDVPRDVQLQSVFPPPSMMPELSKRCPNIDDAAEYPNLKAYSALRGARSVDLGILGSSTETLTPSSPKAGSLLTEGPPAVEPAPVCSPYYSPDTGARRVAGKRYSDSYNKQEHTKLPNYSKLPVTVDMSSIIKTLEVTSSTKVTVGSLVTVPTVDGAVERTDDAVAANAKKPKERDIAPKKRHTTLKKIIMKEREERKLRRLELYSVVQPGEKLEDEAPALPKLEDPSESTDSDNEETLTHGVTLLSQESDVDAMNSSFSCTQSDPVSQVSLSSMSTMSSGLMSPTIATLNVASKSQLLPKIHSRKFREYCNQILDSNVDEACLQLLQTLCRFQDRQFQKEPIKSKAKRRIVMGLREVTKHIRLKKIKCLIISPNLEKIQSKGGLDEQLEVVIALAREQETPFIFALGRKQLGKAVNKAVPVSIVGIFNYEGANNLYYKVLSLSAEGREKYKQFVLQYQTDMEKQEKSAVSISQFYLKKGHNRNASGCSMISFSSVMSEPISENYPESEPDFDSDGNEISKPRKDNVIDDSVSQLTLSDTTTLQSSASTVRAISPKQEDSSRIESWVAESLGLRDDDDDDELNSTPTGAGLPAKDSPGDQVAGIRGRLDVSSESTDESQTEEAPLALVVVAPAPVLPMVNGYTVRFDDEAPSPFQPDSFPPLAGTSDRKILASNLLDYASMASRMRANSVNLPLERPRGVVATATVVTESESAASVVAKLDLETRLSSKSGASSSITDCPVSSPGVSEGSCPPPYSKLPGCLKQRIGDDVCAICWKRRCLCVEAPPT